MPIIIPVGFLQVTIVQLVAGASGEVLNVFGVENNASGDANAAAAEIRGAWISDMIPSQSSDLVLTGVRVTGGPGSPEGFAAANAAGTRGAGMEVPNTCVLVKKTTGLAGRENRGRMYCSGLIEGDRDHSNLDAGGLAQWQASVDAFLEDLETALLPMVILHNSVTAPTNVDALIVESRLATQRGRLRD